MAAPLDTYRFAWALLIQHTTGTIYASTTDLYEPNAVAFFNAQFTKRIKNADTALEQSLPDLFYGVDLSQNITFVLDNSDLRLDPTLEWRLVPCVLYHYNRDLVDGQIVFTGLILEADFINTEVHVVIGSQNPALFEELLPMAVIDASASGPFAQTASPGVPIPVVFGSKVPLRPPCLAADIQSDPNGFDYAVGYGDLQIVALYLDSDRDRPGLERLGTWANAPGSPVFVDTTHFSVTGPDQSKRYYDSCPIRFKTTASGANFLYSFIAIGGYNPTPTPDQVAIVEALLGTGLNTVQINGDFLILRNIYQNITTGLLPVPAVPGANLTAVRVWAPEADGFIAVVTNPAWPSSTHIADIIKEIITNTTWGLSATHAGTPEVCNATSFSAANVALGLANLTGAVAGVLGYDQQQRRAGDLLNELLMLRGMTLGINSGGQHIITVDSQPPAIQKTFVLGPGDQQGIKIARVTAHKRQPVDQAIRNVILHWLPIGRAEAGNQKFTPREYSRISTAPCTGLGQDRHVFNQWIRDANIAERVVYYYAEKLQGADELIEFVTGVEARDVALGEAITVQVPSDGITGDWQVYRTVKTLTEVTINAFKNNLAAYGTPSGVIHSNDPAVVEQRTDPGVGTNLISNPDFSPPLGLYTSGSTSMYPHGWALAPRTAGWGFPISLPVWSLTAELDYSAAILPKTYGGHYLQTTFGTVPTVPSFGAGVMPGLYTEPIAVNAAGAQSVFASIYCNQTDGVFFAISEITGAGATATKFLPVVYDPTDTNAMGWGRFYGRGRLASTTVQVVLLIGVNKDATFLWDAADFRAIGQSGRRPPAWARHKPAPVVLTGVAIYTFSGANAATTTAAALIPAGAYVRGVTTRVTTALVLGAATGIDIGISANPQAWGANINRPAVDQVTDGRDFTIGNSTFFPTATAITVTGAAGANVTSGALRVQVEYSFLTPASST